jgi:hypothetical protein
VLTVGHDDVWPLRAEDDPFRLEQSIGADPVEFLGDLGLNAGEHCRLSL